MRLLPREFQDAFVQQPDVFMFFSSIFLAAVLVAAFWMLTGMGKASGMARVALRGQPAASGAAGRSPRWRGRA